MTRLASMFDLWNLLVKKGQLHSKLLEVLWEDIDADTRDAFLDLMIRYGLLVPLQLQSDNIQPGGRKHPPPTLFVPTGAQVQPQQKRTLFSVVPQHPRCNGGKPLRPKA